MAIHDFYHYYGWPMSGWKRLGLYNEYSLATLLYNSVTIQTISTAIQ